MTGFDTQKHIDAMLQTSLALEEQARRYTKDCDRVSDAITRGDKSGVALLWGRDGKMEIVDLNGGSKHVCVKETDGNGVTVEHNFPTWTNEQRSEKQPDGTRKIVEEAGASYEAMGGENFQKAVAQSHERENATKGRFDPVSHEGPARSLAKAQTTGDAAKQKAMAADTKRFNEQQYARNERIFAAMKERSAQIHR